MLIRNKNLSFGLGKKLSAYSGISRVFIDRVELIDNIAVPEGVDNLVGTPRGAATAGHCSCVDFGHENATLSPERGLLKC